MEFSKESTEREQLEYFEQAERKSSAKPFLGLLKDFQQLPIGSSKSTITVLEFQCLNASNSPDNSWAVKEDTFTNLDCLKDYFERTHDEATKLRRLFLFEDPSTEWINLVGLE